VPGGGDPGPVGPGDELEWTLSVQVSDYFALDNVMVDDLLGDGSRFETGFTPTLNGVVMNTDNYTVSRSPDRARRRSGSRSRVSWPRGARVAR